MSTFIKLSLVFISFLNISYAEKTEYSKSGMLVEDSRQKAVNSSNASSYNPKTIEEERTYGNLDIKSNKIEKKSLYNTKDFTLAYKKLKSPKIIFFIDHRFNDAIAVHGSLKNKKEATDLVKEYVKDENSEYIRNLSLERRWLIQDTITNTFIDAKAKLINRKVIVRLAEEAKYKKNLPNNSNESIILNEKIIQIKSSSTLDIDMLNNIIEMQALKKHVDYIIELKISDYSKVKYPTLRAKIFNTRTGSYLGSVMQKNKVKKNSKKVYTYVKKSKEDDFDLEMYSEKFAHKIMKRFVKSSQ